jgi:predicted nuclease of restriction endonuclease-like (RecB) superfamily
VNFRYTTALVRDIERLIQATAHPAPAYNPTLYWQIGNLLVRHALNPRRGEYASQIIADVGRELEVGCGPEYAKQSLEHMIRFATAFPDENTVRALSRQFSWSHFKRLSNIPSPLKRDYYTWMCHIEGWSSRVLADKVSGMVYERTSLSAEPEECIRRQLAALRQKGEVTPALVFQDSYRLDFLDLAETFSERDLETAIMRDMERFLDELGAGFTFSGRQKRNTCHSHGSYIDLLFYNRHLRRLIAVELKIGEFKPADLGQVSFYLGWLDRHVRHPSERSPFGIILCTGKRRDLIEYLDLEECRIHVAEYQTRLPPRPMFKRSSGP